jgi:ATP-dependent DNA helicase RecG
MYDSPEEMIGKIRLGEDTSLELKAVFFRGDRVKEPSRPDLADEIAAIANTAGGVLVLGVDDKTKAILGISLKHLETVERYVYEVCNDSIDPPVEFRTLRMELPDESGALKAVLKVDVPCSLFVHKSAGGYFRRQGSSKREMPPDLLARLFQQRSQARLIRFDEQTVPQANLDDLVPDLWQRFAGPLTRGSREDLLVKLGMARQDEDGMIRPTVAGILMTTKDPRKWMPNAFIQAVAYRGRDICTEGDTAYQLDAADLSGPLDTQIMAACAFVKKNMRIEAIKRMGRKDIPQYDLTAVFEAVVNAAAHRDYSIYGSKIRLRMFADRLELYSPGTVTNTMTVESLPFRQSTRNETVTSLLARCPVPAEEEELLSYRTHMMDKRGEGVPIILERSRALSGREPVYRLIDDAELVLTMYAASLGASNESGGA